MKKETVIVLVLFAAIALRLALRFGTPLNAQFSGSASPTPPAYSLTSLQTDVETVSATYQPIVVSIVTSKDIPIIRRCTFDPLTPYSFGRNCTVENRRIQITGGSGFIVHNKGVILTNKHVVGDEQAEYSVLLNDGTEKKATNIYRDPDLDIALLTVDGQSETVAKLGNSDSLKIGQFIVAIGNALGEFRNSASFGIVSGLERSIVAGNRIGGREELERLIQTDAAINPGNSGGPLINLQGEVVAMNTAKADAENIGFAIPINDIKPIITRYVQ